MKSLIAILLSIIITLSLTTSNFAALKMDRLLLYWNCESGKENILRDISGKEWNAEIKAGKSKWVQGKYGMGINLIQAYAQVDGNIIAPIQNTGGITIMLWMMIIQHSSYDGLVTIKSMAGGCCPYRLMVDPNFNPLWNAGNLIDKLLPSFTFDLNRWYHYALAIDKESSAIYVDGKLIGKQAENSPLPVFNLATVYLGAGVTPGTHPVEDVIFDEVMIWDRTLSESEIRESMVSQGVTVVQSKGSYTATWGGIKARH